LGAIVGVTRSSALTGSGSISDAKAGSRCTALFSTLAVGNTGSSACRGVTATLAATGASGRLVTLWRSRLSMVASGCGAHGFHASALKSGTFGLVPVVRAATSVGEIGVAVAKSAPSAVSYRLLDASNTSWQCPQRTRPRRSASCAGSSRKTVSQKGQRVAKSILSRWAVGPLVGQYVLF
jgi:hypothetical protein